ncbi:MAG: hypothetical protein COZ34_02705 [Candidatus Pacebacteria bacterium CG_4_10_14_3_um_filter_34_15]|nr:hypothetical protein [Candidatus Pacearchaeota archaeon]NCQ66075.1 hypothetical protein [Candidatus Paceibacterota bacterium]OIO45219.1 MAG: hypothetical protein AUJ41_00445 [Candidatus Pacebacteria bacterium CG1_02_43_31]PIQ81091.1 MAG: hypothetical protein COV78_02090 [Candidatus Pacebacteria bacterium CG11_big_fil_rev_8_21_14_0_20_34_55]PIX81559.1 MAG: hypothetical protein COZ34_02705 [Candidatus Pacebacteria bacterium CG_4_10_14_3_um_filter_34_15]PJC43946.1 MAG: hypothetical protein CO0
MKLTRKHVLDYLKEHNLMQVATCGEVHPWIASVYYSFDHDCNLYFLSSPTTIHCKQISQNPNVAVAVTSSNQNMSGLKKGLQIYGVAEKISNSAKVKHALKLWKDSLNVKNNELTHENMVKKIISGRMYKISPKKIKFFNQELFKVKDGEEPMLILK